MQKQSSVLSFCAKNVKGDNLVCYEIPSLAAFMIPITTCEQSSETVLRYAHGHTRVYAKEELLRT